MSEMNREDIIKEILGYQKEALEQTTDHDLLHMVIDFRTSDYRRRLHEEAGHPQKVSFALGEFAARSGNGGYM